MLRKSSVQNISILVVFYIIANTKSFIYTGGCLKTIPTINPISTYGCLKTTASVNKGSVPR